MRASFSYIVLCVCLWSPVVKNTSSKHTMAKEACNAWAGYGAHTLVLTLWVKCPWVQNGWLPVSASWKMICWVALWAVGSHTTCHVPLPSALFNRVNVDNIKSHCSSWPMLCHLKYGPASWTCQENINCVSESLKNVSLYFYVHWSVDFPGEMVCRELTVWWHMGGGVRPPRQHLQWPPASLHFGSGTGWAAAATFTSTGSMWWAFSSSTHSIQRVQ